MGTVVGPETPVASTAGSAATVLIRTRQLGISRRMLATPTGAWTIVAGEGLGRLGVALVQGASWQPSPRSS